MQGVSAGFLIRVEPETIKDEERGLGVRSRVMPRASAGTPKTGTRNRKSQLCCGLETGDSTLSRVHPRPPWGQAGVTF